MIGILQLSPLDGACAVCTGRECLDREYPVKLVARSVLNKPKKEKYEYHAVYPGIARGKRVPSDVKYLELVKRQNVLMLVLLHSCISGRRPPASQAAEAK